MLPEPRLTWVHESAGSSRPARSASLRASSGTPLVLVPFACRALGVEMATRIPSRSRVRDERLNGLGLKEACAAMFARHRVAAFGGAFHVPDVSRYPALFAWDSGYHALSVEIRREIRGPGARALHLTHRHGSAASGDRTNSIPSRRAASTAHN